MSLRGRKLQVITKIASIHLTPEKPRYGGGAWHVEGMVDESIVASAITYLDEVRTLCFFLTELQPDSG